MTSPSYPAALDALANPGPTTETDDTGFELDIVVARLQNCVMAIENKLGIGTGGPPASGAVLRRTATGTSLWGQLQAADVAAGAVGLAQMAPTAVAMRRLALGADLSIGTSAVMVEMSATYRISHAATKAGNLIVLVFTLPFTLGAGETALLGFAVDGAGSSVVCAQASAGPVNENRTWMTSFGTSDTANHVYAPAWRPSGAYTVDSFGVSIAAGTFLLFEIQT